MQEVIDANGRGGGAAAWKGKHQMKTPMMTIADAMPIKKVPGPAIADCRDPLSTVTSLGF
jgi:hypothetical protein